VTDPARPGLWARLRAFARHLKAELLALSLAARDPRTPWYARAWALLVLAYALSLIDLIPDFIPVLGQLDDLLLVPAGLWVALRLVPPGVFADARRATAHPEKLSRSALGAALIVLAWAWWRARRG